VYVQLNIIIMTKKSLQDYMVMALK